MYKYFEHLANNVSGGTLEDYFALNHKYHKRIKKWLRSIGQYRRKRDVTNIISEISQLGENSDEIIKKYIEPLLKFEEDQKHIEEDENEETNIQPLITYNEPRQGRLIKQFKPIKNINLPKGRIFINPFPQMRKNQKEKEAQIAKENQPYAEEEEDINITPLIAYDEPRRGRLVNLQEGNIINPSLRGRLVNLPEGNIINPFPPEPLKMRKLKGRLTNLQKGKIINPFPQIRKLQREKEAQEKKNKREEERAKKEEEMSYLSKKTEVYKKFNEPKEEKNMTAELFKLLRSQYSKGCNVVVNIRQEPGQPRYVADVQQRSENPREQPKEQPREQPREPIREAPQILQPPIFATPTFTAPILQTLKPPEPPKFVPPYIQAAADQQPATEWKGRQTEPKQPKTIEEQYKENPNAFVLDRAGKPQKIIAFEPPSADVLRDQLAKMKAKKEAAAAAASGNGIRARRRRR